MDCLPIGSYSEGSADPRDIADALLDMMRIARHDSPELQNDLLAIVNDDPARDPNCDLDVIDDAINELREYAPPFCYIGAHFGDPTDFGVWINHDAIADSCRAGEILLVNDLSELDDVEPAELLRHSYVAVENDHGNLALYPIRVTVGDCLFSVV